MKHPKIFWTIIILLNCFNVYAWRHWTRDYFFPPYQSFEYHNVSFSISHTTLKYVSYTDITERIRSTVDLTESVQGKRSVPRVTLQMLEELTPEQTPSEFMKPETAAVTNSSEQSAVITFRFANSNEILTKFSHEYSHASLAMPTAHGKLGSNAILGESLAQLIELLANEKHSEKLRYLALNQPGNDNSPRANYLNNPGMATREGELVPSMTGLPYVLGGIAFYDLYHRDGSHQVIVRLLDWLNSQPSYSWKKTIDWLERQYPGWKSDHWILAEAKPGLCVWTFIDLLNGPSLAAVYRDQNTNLAEATLETIDSTGKRTDLRIKKGVALQQIFPSGVAENQKPSVIRCRLAGTSNPWQDVPVHLPELTKNR